MPPSPSNPVTPPDHPKVPGRHQGPRGEGEGDKKREGQGLPSPPKPFLGQLGFHNPSSRQPVLVFPRAAEVVKLFPSASFFGFAGRGKAPYFPFIACLQRWAHWPSS